MTNKFSEPEKIEILLHEYDALSDRVSQFYGTQMALLAGISAIAAACVAGIVTETLRAGSFNYYLLGGFLAVLILAAAWTWLDLDRDTAQVATRIRQIEKRVNDAVSEPLLTWETKYGRGGVVGKHWPRKHR